MSSTSCAQLKDGTSAYMARKGKLDVPGRKVGTKRHDMRWLAPDGTEWDSKLEYAVFLEYSRSGQNIRRAGEEDRLFYTSPVRNGACTQCDSCEVVQRHS